MNAIRVLIAVLAFVFAGRSLAIAAEFSDVESAFQYFNRPGGPNPFIDDVHVQEAQRVLATDIPKTKQLVITALSYGAPKNREHPEKLLSLVGANNGMEALRVILATYPPGDATVPIAFLGGIAASGDAQDMLTLKRVFQKQPDSETVTTVAKLMVEFENPNAATALREMRPEIPGKWQESAELKAFFASATMTSRGNNITSSKSAAVEKLSPANVAPAKDTKLGKTASVPMAGISDLRWLWGLGGLAVIAAVVFALRRRAQG